MKIRDSGMPDEDIWEGFFDPVAILRMLEFPGGETVVVDFGCGYGTFSIAAATLTPGTVHALDIEPGMVAATRERAHSLGLCNVRATRCDFVGAGTGLAEASTDYVMLFNILHAERPMALLAEAFRVLRQGGRAALIHWRSDVPTPRGPDLSIRPRPEQCVAWLEEAGLEIEVGPMILEPYHFGVVGKRLN